MTTIRARLRQADAVLNELGTVDPQLVCIQVHRGGYSVIHVKPREFVRLLDAPRLQRSIRDRQFSMTDNGHLHARFGFRGWEVCTVVLSDNPEFERLKQATRYVASATPNVAPRLAASPTIPRIAHHTEA